MVQGALAPVTRKAYSSILSEFLNFCSLTIGTPVCLPVPEKLVLKYIASSFEKHVSYNSLCSKLSAIAYFHRFEGKDPTGSFVVKRALLGYKKMSPVPNAKIPITESILEKLLDSIVKLSLPGYCTTMFRAMLSLGFFALLRPREIADSRNSLQFSDISISEECLILSFSRYKHSKGIPKIISIPSQKGSLCPLLNVRKFLKIRTNIQGNSFCFPDGTGITYKMFGQWFSDLMQFCNLPFSYSLHCIRVGGATYYALNGYPDSFIQRIGRWSSNSFLNYLNFHTCIYKKQRN